jgi:hypothetical protein
LSLPQGMGAPRISTCMTGAPCSHRRTWAENDGEAFRQLFALSMTDVFCGRFGGFRQEPLHGRAHLRSPLMEKRNPEVIRSGHSFAVPEGELTFVAELCLQGVGKQADIPLQVIKFEHPAAAGCSKMAPKIRIAEQTFHRNE